MKPTQVQVAAKDVSEDPAVLIAAAREAAARVQAAVRTVKRPDLAPRFKTTVDVLVDVEGVAECGGAYEDSIWVPASRLKDLTGASAVRLRDSDGHRSDILETLADVAGEAEWRLAWVASLR